MVGKKLRKPHVAAWRLQVQRPFDCLSAGIPCEQAVFEQTVYDEALEGRNQHSASALVDITKAFETIVLEYAYTAARELKFPPALLRLTLEIRSFLRFLRYEGAISDPVHSLSAVVAGSCFATDLMFVMLVMPIEMMIARFSVRVFAVVDDVTIRAEGAPGAVSTQLGGAVRFFVDKARTRVEDDGIQRAALGAYSGHEVGGRGWDARAQKEDQDGDASSGLPCSIEGEEPRHRLRAQDQDRQARGLGATAGTDSGQRRQGQEVAQGRCCQDL